MPKLNEHLTSTQINKSTVNSDLVSFLQNVIESIGEIPKFDFSIDAPDEIVSNFFENYYIKIDENGSLSNFNIDITVKISTSEAEVIGYILNRSSHSRPLVVRGNEGVGKTTLLKYISSYLWFKCSSCKNLFIPIYVSLGSIESDYSSKQIFDFLDEQLYTKGFSLAYKYFLEEYKTILEWINIHSSFDFKGKFTKKKISEVEYLGSDEFLNSLDDISKKKLILDILEYHTTKIKPVVLFFDDVDRHNIDIHRITLKYIEQKIVQHFVSITAMRTSTYNELDGLIFEKTDITTRTIQYSIETVKHILNKRITNTHQKFKVNSFPKIETRTQNIINAFVRLFSHSESINLLTNLSNKSLDSLFRKIKLMVESDYFDDSLLGRELLLERTESYKEKGQPLWIIFSLLFGNYNGSFLSNEIMADCGILNLFSTKDCKSDSLRHFIRLHLLSAFFSYDDDKDVFFDVRTIYKDYCLIFGNDTQITEVFSRSINRLVQARLLISFKYNNSLRNKSKYLSLSEILEDKIAISTAGRYYLTKLIHRIDYLYFIKDDINWDDTSDLVPASKELVRDNKIRNSLKALLKLVKNEYNLLEYIINVTNKQLFSEINLIRMFTNKFSAYNHSSLHNTICYSRWIYESYKKYIYQIIGYDHATFSAEVKSIEDTFKAFEKIENVFLPKRETFNM